MLPTLSARLLSLALLLSLAVAGHPGLGTAVAVTIAAIFVVLFARRFAAASTAPRLVLAPSPTERTVYRRLADPDAAGHARPRAPGFAG